MNRERQKTTTAGKVLGSLSRAASKTGEKKLRKTKITPRQRTLLLGAPALFTLVAVGTVCVRVWLRRSPVEQGHVRAASSLIRPSERGNR